MSVYCFCLYSDRLSSVLRWDRLLFLRRSNNRAHTVRFRINDGTVILFGKCTERFIFNSSSWWPEFVHLALVFFVFLNNTVTHFLLERLIMIHIPLPVQRRVSSSRVRREEAAAKLVERWRPRVQRRGQDDGGRTKLRQEIRTRQLWSVLQKRINRKLNKKVKKLICCGFS